MNIKFNIKFIVVNVFMATDKNFMSSINVPFSCISIVSPEHPEYKIAENPFCKDILYLRFHDVRADGSVSSIYEIGKNIIRFNDNDAKKIIDFGLKNKEHGNFMIHCEAGISRSTAVALALSEILNNEKNNPEQYVESLYGWKLHNLDIKKKILNTYYKEK